MPHQEVELIVVSTSAYLDEIERILGDSDIGGHSIGSSRSNGLIRRHSMWLKKMETNTELLEDLVDEALGWLSIRYGELKDMDQAILCKISCRVPTKGVRVGFTVTPQTAKLIAELDLVLLLDV